MSENVRLRDTVVIDGFAWEVCTDTLLSGKSPAMRDKLVIETMVLPAKRDKLPKRSWVNPYDSWTDWFFSVDDAVAGHDKIVARLKASAG